MLLPRVSVQLRCSHYQESSIRYVSHEKLIKLDYEQNFPQVSRRLFDK